jgi:pre-rRNA-processing protein TSR1
MVPSTDPNKEGFGTLLISGYIRGNKLDPNNLIILPDYGEFQLEKVVIHPDPYSVKRNEMSFEETIFPVPEKIESLERVNTSTLELFEQNNFHTLEEIDGQVKEKKIPQGFSSYQAAWIPDDEDYDKAFEEFDQLYDEKIDEIIDSENNKDDINENTNPENDEIKMDEEQETFILDDNETSDDQLNIDIDVDDMDLPDKQLIENSDEEPEVPLTEEEMIEKLREEEKEDIDFPDETDVPTDVAARERYQKYRGLKSFRTSPLDPKENLPTDYAKIFQFENSKRTRKVVFSKHTGIEPGKFVTLHLKDVQINMLEKSR